MGAYIDFESNIEIHNIGNNDRFLERYSYKELTDEFIQGIVDNPVIKTIQTSTVLDEKAFPLIDRILERRPDLCFRIFGLYRDEQLDLDCLLKLPHLKHICLDIYRGEMYHGLQPQKLSKLKGLKSLKLDLFDCMDYSFIRDIDKSLEELYILSNSMKGTPKFDAEWLLDFPNLTTLYLGQKAKKHFKCVGQIKTLKRLSLRGIKIDNFEFLRDSNIEWLDILWASVGSFDAISCVKNLKTLQLWRIPKLDDISFISGIESLESLIIQDLSHISGLPDVSNLKHFKELTVLNMRFDKTTIPESVVFYNR